MAQRFVHRLDSEIRPPDSQRNENIDIIAKLSSHRRQIVQMFDRDFVGQRLPAQHGYGAVKTIALTLLEKPMLFYHFLRELVQFLSWNKGFIF